MPDRFFAVCLLTFLSYGALAQGYNTAGGLRVGAGAGLSLVQRVGPKQSVEFIGQNRFGTDAFTLTVVGRRHVALGLKRINIFVGGGIHKGWGYEDEGKRGNPFGITVQGGAEVTFGRTNVSFDILPQVHLSGRVVPASFGSAVSLRYVISKRKSNVSIKRPWESEDEQRDREKEREKRHKERDKRKKAKSKARSKARRRGETKTLRERLGLE